MKMIWMSKNNRRFVYLQTITFLTEPYHIWLGLTLKINRRQTAVKGIPSIRSVFFEHMSKVYCNLTIFTHTTRTRENYINRMCYMWVLLTLPYLACQAKKYSNAANGCPTRQKLIQKMQLPMTLPCRSRGNVAVMRGSWTIMPMKATPAILYVRLRFHN